MSSQAKKHLFHSSLAVRRARVGWLFVLPFLIGFVFLFLSPLLLYIQMSFSEMEPGNGFIQFNWVGIEHYRDILLVKQDFLKQVFASIGDLLLNCPSVLLFSFFVATMLNQTFKGRGFARAIFFLPVITASGIALSISSESDIMNSLAFLSGDSSSPDSMNLMEGVYTFFRQVFGDISITEYITAIVDRIYTITISSGVQILIFLAGLQTIPSALYEASAIEGATGWENFWKITLPMISPMIVVNTVYTLIDSMTGLSNSMIKTIYTEAMTKNNYCYSAALGILYFTISIVILIIVVLIVNRFAFYENR